MAAAVAVEMQQRAKQDGDEGSTPPQPAARRPRHPTPDHPPYCWMIGEAIDELGEDGGSAEDSISSFIRARHPGVPAAHDTFLRHYLARHVAEGIFECTAPGRYGRIPDEAAAGSSEAQVKGGRRLPRKDRLSSTPPAIKKDRTGGSATPKRRERRLGVAPLTSGDDHVPSSSVAAVDESRSQAAASAPKPDTTTDVSAAAPVTDISWTSTAPERRSQSSESALVAAEMTDGDEAPSKYKRLCQLRQTPSVVIDPVPTSASAKKARGKTLSSAPPKAKDRQQHILALAATVPVTAVGDNVAPSIAPKPQDGLKMNRPYPLAADEIPDDPSLCLLALPAAASASA